MKERKIHLFCFDDHRSASEDVKRLFGSKPGFTVYLFQSINDLINKVINEKSRNFCRIVIISIHDNREQYELVEKTTLEIKKADFKTGLILIVPPEKLDDVKKNIRFNIDAYIPRNGNSNLRLNNSVTKLISEFNLILLRNRRTLSLRILIAVCFISILALILSYIFLPVYF